MLCLSQLPASLLDSGCTNVFQNIAFAVGAISGVYWFIRLVWQKIKEKYSYTVRFRRPDHALSEITEIQTVPVGTYFLDVMIRANRNVSIHYADIRFVIDKLHRQHPRSDADIEAIEITQVKDLDIDPPRFSGRTGTDQAGGCDLIYSPAYNRGKGDFLRVRIRVVAKKEWQGYISFRESRIYSYYPFRIVNGKARQDRLNRISGLLDIRTEGMGLLEQQISDSEYVAWHQAFESWRARFVEEARELDPELAERLNSLGILQDRTRERAIHTDHGIGLNTIWEMQERFNRYLSGLPND